MTLDRRTPALTPTLRRASMLVLGLAVGLVPAGCTDVSPSGEDVAASAVRARPSAEAGPRQGPRRVEGVDPRYALVQDLLDARARAVVDGDLEAFTATLASGPGVDRRFRAQQRRWFRNLQDLPVATLAYEVEGQQWTPDELPERRLRAPGVFLPVVTTTLRLERFDDGPVSRLGGVTVVRGADGYRVAAVDDVDGAGDAAIGDAPWDLARLVVRRQARAGRTLLLLDDRSAGQADLLMPLLTQGTARVQATVPFDWDGDVVAYATGDDEVIAAIDDVPGGDVAQVGALAFPVYEAAGRGDIAAFRFALNPDVLDSDPIFLRRLVTHELTHVAFGTRDDGAPTWLAEGIAEYVGAQGLDPTRTRIAVAVVDRARDVADRLAAGEGVDLRLPPSRDFNGPDAEWHYGLSWYAVEWIVAERGPETVWRLVRAMARGQGTADDEQDAVLRRVVGVDEGQLVRNAVDRILATYDR